MRILADFTWKVFECDLGADGCRYRTVEDDGSAGEWKEASMAGDLNLLMDYYGVRSVDIVSKD